MKLWILGAGGLLGRALVALCRKKGLSYIATGRELDIADREALAAYAERERPTHAINCAAYTNVDLAETESAEAFAVNAFGPESLGRIGLLYGFQVVHLSTDYVFDGAKRTAYAEGDLCSPLNVYGKSKRLGEELLFRALPTACVVRTSWLFGEGGKSFISKLVGLLQTRPFLEVDDLQVNRPTFVGDLAEAVLKLCDCRGIWHFAGQGETTRLGMATYIQWALRQRNLPCLCEKIVALENLPKLAAVRPLYSALSTEKVEAFFGHPLKHWQEVIL